MESIQGGSAHTTAILAPSKKIVKGSGIPRPLTQASVKYKSIVPFSDNGNANARSRFGFGARPVGVTAPSNQDAQQVDDLTDLQTTPTKAEHQFLSLGTSDENNFGAEQLITPAQETATPRRAPRPSLSERTIETLSMIPPSPIPSRHRSNTGASNNSVGSQPFLSPAPRTRRLDQSPAARGLTPRRSIAQLSTRPKSPSKNVPAIPAPSMSTSRSTPHKTLSRSKGAIGASQPPLSQQSSSTTADANALRRLQPPSQLHGHKVRSLYDLRAAAAISSGNKPAAPSISRDILPMKTAKDTSRASKAGSEIMAKTVRTAPESPLKTQLTRPQKIPSRVADPIETMVTDEGLAIASNSKSSQTLRETIAKAKAAKRQRALAVQDLTPTKNGHSFPMDNASETARQPLTGLSLKKRIQSALITGALNIAASGLTQIPEEVMHMYDFDEDSKIPWSEVVDMIKLIASDNEIVEISDTVFPDWSMQDVSEDDERTNVFVCLESLDLHNNQLSGLPSGLRRLKRLQVLNLNNNTLGNDAFEPICQLHNLKELHVANNKLTGLLIESVADLQQLRVLDVHGNSLCSFPSGFSRLRALQRLDASRNAITSIPSEMANAQLLNLNLSHNKLSGTLFETSLPSSLVHLDVSNNRLERVCAAQFDVSVLQTLAVDNNILQDLPDLSQLPALLTLTASQNRLKAIPHGFTALRSVRNVNFSCNDIKQIDPEVANMESLAALNLAGNPLRERRFLTMNLEDLKIDLAGRLELSDVDDISVGGSSFHDASSTIQPSPTFHSARNGLLDLSSRDLISVPIDLIDFSSPIQSIKLSHNNLTFFPVQLLSHPEVAQSLRSLDLSHNTFHPLSYLSSALNLPQLQTLDLSDTNMAMLNGLINNLSAPRLHTLTISNNRLTETFPQLRSVFPCLTTIIAPNNRFSTLDVAAVQGLEVLDVRDNELEAIPPKIGELGNHPDRAVEMGWLRSFECGGNKFRVPRLTVLEKGTEAVLRDLRRMVPVDELGEEWQDH